MNKEHTEKLPKTIKKVSEFKMELKNVINSQYFLSIWTARIKYCNDLTY